MIEGPRDGGRRARRNGGAWLLAAAVLLLTACEQKSAPPAPSSAAAAAAPRAKKAASDGPRTDNIVLYVIDSLRADRTGLHGYHTLDTTPRMEALAAESAVFKQAYAPAPWTLPSLASLMMTTVPCEHGVVSRHERLGNNSPTFARRLRRMNYATVGLFATAWAAPKFGLQQGFETYEFAREVGRPTFASVLERTRPPFFFYVHSVEPRDPMELAPPERPGFPSVGDDVRRELSDLKREYVKATRADFLAGRPLGTTDNTAEQQRLLDQLTARRDEYSNLYDAAVRAADDRLGNLIDALKERGLWDSTLLIVCSTSGTEFGEHGGWFDDQSVYEELIHVPLLIHFPESEHAGVRVQEPVSLIDVMPTVFDFLGRKGQAEQTRGRSLMPLIRSGGSAPANPLPSVVAHRINRMTRFEPQFADRGDENIVVRAGSLKFIWNVQTQSSELYDLSSDPAEAENLSERRPKVAQQMLDFAKTVAEKCATTRSFAVPAEDDSRTGEGED